QQNPALSFVYDGSLRTHDYIDEAIAKGRIAVVKYNIVPPSQSLLRILAREPGGSDPLINYNTAMQTYGQSLQSLETLINRSRDPSQENTFILEVYGPKRGPDG